MEQNKHMQEATQTEPGRQYPYLAQGDVTDGSVDYYDFDWGEEVLYDLQEIPYGSQGWPYEGCCTSCCPGCPEPDPEPDPCVPEVPEQVDDPIYEIVEP